MGASPLLSVFFLVVLFTAAPAVSVAASGESYSTATGGELWAIPFLAVSAASAMSADTGAALGRTEALGLAGAMAAVSGISIVLLCHVCRVCVLFFSTGG